MPSNQLFENYISRISNLKDRTQIEKEFYNGLSESLKHGKFKIFKKLIDKSINFDIFIDVKKIPNRFKLISLLLLSCTERISEGYQTSALGDIIDVLRFCNKFNLLEKELNEDEKKILESVKEDKLFLSNLNDFFGKVSDSFILYIYKVMPQDLYDYFINNPLTYFPNRDGLMDYIKNIFFNQYTIYGLSIRYLSPIKRFIDDFNKNYLFYRDRINKEKRDIILKENKFIEFSVVYKYNVFYYDADEEHEHSEIKRHLVSPKNIFKNTDKFLAENNYNFYNLSMILMGGIGPQGLGFTYSTPKGEIIEICTDVNQNKAIIIKFKEFLKNQFIEKLEKELQNYHIKADTIKKIVDYLVETLSKEEKINYPKKKSIISHVENFLVEDGYHRDFYEIDFQDLIDKFSNAISAILRPIKMIDQYKARMNLIADGKLNAEDIAKLTSLKEKSHYDVLRERFFFQYIIDWFYDIYSSEKLKSAEDIPQIK